MSKVKMSEKILNIHQRPILNRPLGQTLSSGAKLSPMGEFCPLGVKLSHGGGEIRCLPFHFSK
jgi:hypothetical protein